MVRVAGCVFDQACHNYHLNYLTRDAWEKAHADFHEVYKLKHTTYDTLLNEHKKLYKLLGSKLLCCSIIRPFPAQTEREGTSNG